MKTKPREPVQQRPPYRSYHEQVHGQVYDEHIGHDIDRGTVAIDTVDDASYDYQYDDTGYEANGDNAAFAEQQE